MKKIMLSAFVLLLSSGGIALAHEGGAPMYNPQTLTPGCYNVTKTQNGVKYIDSYCSGQFTGRHIEQNNSGMSNPQALDQNIYTPCYGNATKNTRTQNGIKVQDIYCNGVYMGSVTTQSGNPFILGW